MTEPLHHFPQVIDKLARAIHQLDSCPKGWDELHPVEVDQYRSEAEHYAAALSELVTFTAAARAQDRALMAAGVISASAAQRVLAAQAKTNSGKAEHEDFAEWLETFGQSLVDLGR